MDVDRVQKINNLALELMKQGLAQERDEAIKQAEVILAKEDCSSLSETMEEVKELDLETGEVKKAEETLSLDNVREILEKNTVFIVKKMKEHQEQVEGLKQEISELRKELGGVRSKLANMQIRQESMSVKKEEPQQKLEAKNSGEDHPRSGNFEDNSVSIGDFFYSGSRPKG